jgi:NAD(P)-dependent dehydrogenase (short-subunit alcohol dehydrogenase family)
MRDEVEWTPAKMPRLDGKRAIVTGSNSGIGLYTALELARAGADVTLAVRDTNKGAEARATIVAAVPAAKVAVEALDLASLASVRAFAERMLADPRPIDLLVNNAGVMALPKRQTTTDGFERQLGTNHFGHFALTALLWPRITAAPAPRVVTVSSSMAYVGKLDFDDLQHERHYGPMRTYAMSKLANLHFMLELGRRAPGVVSVAAHPGASATNLQRESGFSAWFVRNLGQSAEQGAWPTLYAAVADDVNGAFIGPRDRFGMVGPPKRTKLPKRAHDDAAAAALWTRSEELTGVRFGIERAAVSRAS